jgi:hypothetical protein
VFLYTSLISRSVQYMERLVSSLALALRVGTVVCNESEGDAVQDGTRTSVLDTERL